MSSGFYHPNSLDPSVDDVQNAQDFSSLSKDWAIKMDGPVEGSSYSSQWNATLSAQKAGEAAGSADDALESMELAAEWSSAPVDTFVSGTSQYSAMHWALKAAASQSSIDDSVTIVDGYVEQAAQQVASLPATLIDSTTSRTLALTDNRGYIRFTNAGAVTVTVPDEAATAFAVDSEIHLRAATAGTVTITPAAGVTINTPSSGGLVLAEAGATATLKKVGSDEWDLFGLVSA